MSEAAAQKAPEKEKKESRPEPVELTMRDDHFAFSLLALVAIIIPLFIWYTHSIYAWSHEHKGTYKQPQYTQIWMTGMGVITFAIFKEMLELVTWQIFKRVVPAEGSDFVQQKKIKALCDSVWGILYFSGIVYWGYHTLGYSKWLPQFLGGKHPQGSIEATYESLFFIDTPPGTHCYILFSLGHHVLEFWYHLKADKEEDWRELFLHHTAVLIMYPSFFFSNLMGIGVLLSFIHDIADVFLNIQRLCARIHSPMWIQYCTFAITIAVYTYTRLMVLPFMIYKIISEVRYPEAVDHFNHFIKLQSAFLVALQLTHVYNFVQIFRHFGRVISPKVIDEGKKVEKQVKPAAGKKND